MIGYKGVKFDDKGQNILASGVIIQLQDGENYVAGLAEGQCREAAGHALQGLVILSRGGQHVPAQLPACLDAMSSAIIACDA